MLFRIALKSFSNLIWSTIFFVLPAQASLLYNNIPASQSPDRSWAYEVDQTAEFGALVQVGDGSPATLDSAVVAMSNWAVQSSWSGVGTSNGFSVPLTLNLYNLGPDGAVGTLFSTITVNALIPWRPEADPVHCGAGTTQYYGDDGVCHDGSLSTVTFNLGGVNAPGQFIYGLAYNTEDWGSQPTGVDGPYDSLNFSLSTDPPSVGSNPLPDTAYLNTSIPGWYSDHGPSGTFRQDQGWSSYGSGAIQFNGSAATPEPSTLLLVGLSIAGLGAKVAFRR